MRPALPSPRSLLVLLAAPVLLAAGRFQAAQQPARAATVSAADFAGLRWIAGTWRGRLPQGGYFYERYTFVDDSTIEVRHLDSTLAPTGAPVPVTLRGGVVRYENATATRVSAAGISFAVRPGAPAGFDWAPARGGGWTATIRSADRAGTPRSVVYRMERAAAGAPPAQGDARADVRRAVLDYVEGFYEGDTAKLVRSVWPEVRKYGYGRRAGGGYEGMAMRFPEGFMGYANGVRAGRGGPPPGAPKEITVYDVQDQTASAKLTAWWGTDYLLLAREGGRWMITHVLWQSGPPAAAAARGR